MRLKRCIEAKRAFTGIELVVVLLTTVLLSAVALSVLGNTAVRSDLGVCSNNLRQIGRAFDMWASDHGGENPWWTPYSSGGGYFAASGPPPPGNTVIIPGAGSVSVALRNNTWYHFGFVGEELRTPTVLVCPSDRTKRRASEFSSDRDKGYFNPSFQSSATSYLIGAHAMSMAPLSLLSGDRSLREDGVNGSCSVNLGILSWMQLDGGYPGWTSDLHPAVGNLLLNDGSVHELSAPGLKEAFPVFGENASTHFAK